MQINGLRTVCMITMLLVLLGCNNEVESIIANVPDKLSERGLDKRCTEFLEEIATGDFEVCRDDSCVSLVMKSRIYQYHKQRAEEHARNGYTGGIGFKSIYTFDRANWSSGCVILGDKPSNLISYVIETNEHIGFVCLHGGFGISSSFHVYSKNSDRILDHWRIGPISELLNPSDMIKFLSEPNVEITS